MYGGVQPSPQRVLKSFLYYLFSIVSTSYKYNNAHLFLLELRLICKELKNVTQIFEMKGFNKNVGTV